MSIIDRVVRRYEAVAREPIAVVHEWADESGRPTLVYADPWTVSDNERFRKLHGDEKDWAAEIVVAKARDADGNALFDKVDVVRLSSKGERHVVNRVAHAIMFSMTLDDAKKNSALGLTVTEDSEQ